MTHSPQLILLPGLGADRRLLEPQKRAFTDLLIHDWIPPEKDESLAHYASRLAETIMPRGPMILGGVSLGGMVACEMARHLQPQAVVLIASCRWRGGIRPLFRALGPIVPALPVAFFGALKPLAPPVLRMFGRLTSEQRRSCIAMFNDTDPGFIKWACKAIPEWQPRPLEGIRVFHIHGRQDPIIPLRLVNPDEIVPGGGHLINLTHPDQVNRFIQKAVDTVQ